MRHFAIALFSIAAPAFGGCDVSQTPPWPDDEVCARECAAEQKVPCDGAPSESECVAMCEAVRASRTACAAEDAAFRQCFVTFPLVCSSGRRLTSSCAPERDALDACIADHGDAGALADSGAPADAGEF